MKVEALIHQTIITMYAGSHGGKKNKQYKYTKNTQSIKHTTAAQGSLTCGESQ